MKYLEAKKKNNEPTVEDGTSHKMPPPLNKMQPGTRADQGGEAPISGLNTESTTTQKATDAVRRLATELKVELADVKGTGKNGAITEADVRRTATEQSKSAEAK